MLRLPAYVSCFALLSCASFGQSTGTAPKFEAADVHIASQTLNRFMRGGNLHGSRYEIRNASMVDLITEAYGVDDDKVLGGPTWLEMDRFDVIANAPPKSTPESLKLMLQSLLAERFKLVVRQESKPMPAYALTVGKHLLIKEADGSGETGCKQSLQGLPNGPGGDGPVMISSLTISLSCRNMTIAAFVDRVPVPRQSSAVNRPVVDQTGLKGEWNFDFKFSLGGAPGDTVPISDALDKQLGLKLDSVTLPMPVVEVQSVNQKPTPNAPEEMKSFPPLPTEFDVAEIKPSAPGEANSNMVMINGGMQVVMAKGGGRGGRGAPMLQNGRVNLQGYTLKNLILLAWDLNSEDMLLGAPKWMDTDRFDVIAKVPGGPSADAFSDMDSIKPLLRTLLLDRFKMAIHNEDKPVGGWVLTAAKPKLKKADPAGRTKWINGPAPDAKDPRNGNQALGRLITCQNMTVAQFAALLPNIAGGYIRTPVLDETGLEGAWDFTLYFSPAGMVNGFGFGGRGGDAGGTPGGNSASDPSGGMSLFDAVNKQLGLKLEMQKRPMPVLMIDHVEQKPTDN
jgi:uncharacterized protein (TIGR03435 family)